MLYASLVETSHRALATPDIIIIGFYFALVFGIGMYFARRERTSEEYFLAGRNVGWFNLADSWLGIRTVLFAEQRVYDATVFGTTV